MKFFNNALGGCKIEIFSNIVLPLRRLKWSEIGLATASGCIKFTLATASDQNSCTRSGHLKGVWQLPFTLATASELWQLPLWQLPLTLATASDYS